MAILWLVGGTFGLKALLRATQQRRVPRSVYVLVAVAAAPIPAIAMKLQLSEFSAIGVVSAAATLFWFALLVARVGNAA